MSKIILKRCDNAPAIEACWIDDDGRQTICQTYLAEQMDQLRADVGEVSDDCLEMISDVAAEATPYVQPPEEYVEGIMAAVQAMLDNEAKAHSYDGILSLCSYAVSTVPAFAAEGEAGVAWRDAVWMQCHAMLDECTSGAMVVPYTLAEVMTALPAMQWP